MAQKGILKRTPTDQQVKFVLAYMSNGNNATQAAKTAGYAGNNRSLTVTGSRLLTSVSIKGMIEARHKDITCKANITIAGLVKELDEVILQAKSKNDLASWTKAVELKGKTIGAWSDVVVSRTPEQAAEYDEERKREAIRLSNLRLKAG